MDDRDLSGCDYESEVDKVQFAQNKSITLHECLGRYSEASCIDQTSNDDRVDETIYSCGGRDQIFNLSSKSKDIAMMEDKPCTTTGNKSLHAVDSSKTTSLSDCRGQVSLKETDRCLNQTFVECDRDSLLVHEEDISTHDGFPSCIEVEGNVKNNKLMNESIERNSTDDDLPLSSLRYQSQRYARNITNHMLENESWNTGNKNVNESRNKEKSGQDFPSMPVIQKRIFEIEILPKLEICGWKIFRKHDFDTGSVDWVFYPPRGTTNKYQAEYFTCYKILRSHLAIEKAEQDGVIKWMLEFLHQCDHVAVNMIDDIKSSDNNRFSDKDLDFISMLIIERAKEYSSITITSQAQVSEENKRLLLCGMYDRPSDTPFQTGIEQDHVSKKSPNASTTVAKVAKQNASYDNLTVANKMRYVTASKRIPRFVASIPFISTKDVDTLKEMIVSHNEFDFDITLTANSSRNLHSTLQYRGPEDSLERVGNCIESFLNKKFEQAYVDKLAESPLTIKLYVKMPTAQILDFEVGEGDVKKDGLFMYSMGGYLESILGKLKIGSGLSLFSINNTPVKCFKEIRKLATLNVETNVLFHLNEDFDLSECHFDRISKAVCCDGSKPKQILILERDEPHFQSSEKKDINKLSYNALFKDKISPVYEIEYSTINKHSVMKSMWSSHKIHFGETCKDDCKCILNLTMLTRNVVSDALTKLSLKENPKQDFRWESCGFMNYFSPYALRKLQEKHAKADATFIFSKLVNIIVYIQSIPLIFISFFLPIGEAMEETCVQNRTCLWANLSLSFFSARSFVTVEKY